MNKKIIYLRIFIKSIFCISLVLVFSLHYLVARKQESNINISLKKLIEGLEKNYIINVRPVDDQTQCNKNETAISTLSYQYQNEAYNLDFIEIGEENHKHIGILSKSKKVLKFMRLEQQEMQELY